MEDKSCNFVNKASHHVIAMNHLYHASLTLTDSPSVDRRAPDVPPIFTDTKLLSKLAYQLTMLFFAG